MSQAPVALNDAAKQKEREEEFLGKYNFWLHYNNPQLPADQNATLEGARAFYRNHPYIVVDIPEDPDPANFVPWGAGTAVIPEDIHALNAGNRDFLEQKIPGLVSDPQGGSWKGVRFLGSGGFSRVGLWEHDGQGPNPPKVRRVAVKELRDRGDRGDHNLKLEGLIMQALGRTLSEHVVRLIAEPLAVVPADEGLGDEWKDVVRRLIMEYCPQGTLWDLLNRRITKQVPFVETTLWRICNCLVDGLSVMEYGNEIKWDPLNRKGVASPRKNWDALVHFDLKPPNILLGDRDINHSWAPICKIGDFGLTRRIPENTGAPDPDMDKRNELFRRRGTKYYYAPEQFSDRWNYADWREGGIAGVYGPATNVWGLGIIMHCLTLLTHTKPDHTAPFLPSWPINSAPPKGRTYGANLQSYPYSQALKDLIFSCLYEVPAHRPTLLELKAQVMEGCAVAHQVCEGEPWADLQAPAPIDYAVAQARIWQAVQAGRVQDAEALRAALEASEITDSGKRGIGNMAAAQGARERVGAVEAEKLRAELEISELTDPNADPGLS